MALFGHRWPHHVQTGRFTKADLVKLLETANEGIWRYDEHLFRIRSWWMTISALLIIGFLSDVVPSPSGSLGIAKKSAQFGYFVVTVIGLGFWSLDAMNKSLQLVLIHMARDIEQAIFFDIPVWAPTKSRRYKMRDGRHLWNILKNMSEQSVAPFYLIPILGAGLIFYVDHWSEHEIETLYCPYFFSIEGLALWTAGWTVIVLFSSFYLRNKWTHFDCFIQWFSLKAKKRHIIKVLEDEKVIESGSPKRLRGFQFNFMGPRSVLFVDYPRTWEHESYVMERHMLCEYYDLRAYILNVKSLELLDCGERRVFAQGSLKDAIAYLSPMKN